MEIRETCRKGFHVTQNSVTGVTRGAKCDIGQESHALTTILEERRIVRGWESRVKPNGLGGKRDA